MTIHCSFLYQTCLEPQSKSKTNTDFNSFKKAGVGYVDKGTKTQQKCENIDFLYPSVQRVIKRGPN